MNRLIAGLRRRRVDPRLVDALLAAAAVTAGQIDIWLNLAEGSGGAIVREHHLLAALLSLLGMSMLLLRRRAPLTGIAVMAGTLLTQVALFDPVAYFFGGFVPVLFMTYAVAAYGEGRRTARVGLAVALVTVTLVSIAVPQLRTWSDLAFDAIVILMVWALGRIVGSNIRRADELASRASELELQHERAVAGERSRLARELHDIVAHSVSVIAIQAEAGEALLDQPDRAAEAFRSIQATSRQALVELRHLLGLLRPGGTSPSLEPQPGLAEVGELIERVRAAGLGTELTIEGAPPGVDPGVDLSAYRIVQEALTNALKHAGSARAQVRIRYLPQALEVEVVDDGDGNRNGNGNGAGRGLIGIRERAALYGGEVSTDSPPEGGFVVRAHLPLVPS